VTSFFLDQRRFMKEQSDLFSQFGFCLSVLLLVDLVLFPSLPFFMFPWCLLGVCVYNSLLCSLLVSRSVIFCCLCCLIGTQFWVSILVLGDLELFFHFSLGFFFSSSKVFSGLIFFISVCSFPLLLMSGCTHYICSICCDIPGSND
jgi:hypothetical protein